MQRDVAGNNSTWLACASGEGHWGVPNTAVPYEKLANTEIPCRKWTKYRYRIYDRWRLLNVVSISRVFLSQSCIHQKSTSTFARKREKISNWSVQRSKSHFIGCPKSKVFQILTYIRRERSNEQYRNTWRIFFYRIPLARRMKNRIPQGWMIPQYHTLKSKLSKYRLKKSSIPQYRKPPCPPSSAWNSLLSAMKSVLKCLYIGIECPEDAFARKAVTASADRRRKFGFNVHITINTG